MRARLGSVVGVILSCACSGGSGPDGDPGDQADGGAGSHADASPSDAAVGPDGSPGADAAPSVDAGLDAGVDAGDGGGADAAPGGMVIDSVLIDGAFTQVHQGSEFEIVIAGSGLEGVTDITFDGGGIELPGSLVATPTEVRAVMFVFHGAAPGPRDVTVTSPDGSATATAAFEVTPWVFGPGAASGGRATFDSPMALGEFYDGARSGDTLLLLAGEHRSDQGASLEDGVSVTGQGTATTVVRGDTGVFPGFQFGAGNPLPVFSALRDVTVITQAGVQSVLWGGGLGTLTVEDVVLMGDGIRVASSSLGPIGVTINRMTFDAMGGGATGLRTVGTAGATISDSSFSRCDTGVWIEAGEIDLTGTTIEGCATGLRVGNGGTVGGGGSWRAAGDQFLDNTTGILLDGGSMVLSDTLIADDEATAAASERGVFVSRGELYASDVTITGQDIAGAEAYRPNCCENPDYLGLDLYGALIEGGQRGVHIHGVVDAGHLVLRSSIVRDQTVAAVSVGMEDGGLLDVSGDNQLSVASGFALEDTRLDNSLDLPIEAAGVTLNGNSYAGLVVGPASVPPDYRLLAGGVIQF